jgi:hypothetical protein
MSKKHVSNAIPIAKCNILPPPIPREDSKKYDSLTLWLTQAGLSGDKAARFAKFLVDKHSMSLSKMDLQYSDERWPTTMNGYKGIDDDDKTLISNALEKKKRRIMFQMLFQLLNVMYYHHQFLEKILRNMIL